MGETKTFIVPDGNAGAFGASGMEGMMLGSMMNGGGYGGGMWNNPIWAIVFLAALRNGGIFGNNGCNEQSQLSQIQDTLNTNQGNTLLMNAISGNATSIKELAGAINCNQNAVTGAINAVQAALSNIGNQSNMNAMQVVNAIQSGNTALANQLSQCCCDNKLLTTTQGYENRIANLQQSQLIQNGFCQVGYEAAQNANGIKQSIGEQTLAVIGKIDAMDKDRLQRENSALTAQVATLTARAERAAELAPIYKTLEEIKGKQPSTAVVQYPNLIGVPASMLYGGAIAAGAAAGVFGVGGNTGGIFG